MSPDFDYIAASRKLSCFPLHCKLEKSYSVYHQVNKAFLVRGFTELHRVAGEAEAYPKAQTKANKLVHLPLVSRCV